MLGLKSRPSVKQSRRPIIMFRDLVGFKKTHNVSKSRPSIDILKVCLTQGQSGLGRHLSRLMPPPYHRRRAYRFGRMAVVVACRGRP